MRKIDEIKGDAIQLDLIKVKDFTSASNIVKRIDLNKIFSIDVYLGDVQMILKPGATKKEIVEAFSNRITENDITIDDEIPYIYSFDPDLDGFVLTNAEDTIDDIYKMAALEQKHDCLPKYLIVAIFLAPEGVELKENERYFKLLKY
jgi:hypothetical protein